MASSTPSPASILGRMPAIRLACILVTAGILLSRLFGGCSDPQSVGRIEKPDTTDSTGTTDSTRIAVIGDYGLPGPNAAEVAALVKSWDPDFVVTTGDNCYSAAIDSNIGQYYSEFIFPYSGEFTPGASPNRFFPSLGNHDWDEVINVEGDSSTGVYLDYFTLPGNERYYQATLGPLDLFVIDSDNREPDGRLVTSIQAAWLQGVLAGSNARWKVVCFHHPPFASGARDSLLDWPYREWGAAAVLSGHLHAYERILKEGFPYFVNGLGGRSLHPFGDTIDPDSQVRFNADFGAMLVVVDDRFLRFQFFSVEGGGTLIDTYRIAHPDL